MNCGGDSKFCVAKSKIKGCTDVLFDLQLRLRRNCDPSTNIYVFTVPLTTLISEYRLASSTTDFHLLPVMTRPDPEALLREASSYSAVRSPTWQGPAARSGPRFSTSAQASAPDLLVEQPRDDSLWNKLRAAAGNDDRAASAIAHMQRALLKSIDALPLDEIELMARK